MTCDSIEIGLSECSNGKTIYFKFEVFLLGDWLGRVVGIELGTNEGYKLGCIFTDTIFLAW